MEGDKVVIGHPQSPPPTRENPAYKAPINLRHGLHRCVFKMFSFHIVVLLHFKYCAFLTFVIFVQTGGENESIMLHENEIV